MKRKIVVICFTSCLFFALALADKSASQEEVSSVEEEKVEIERNLKIVVADFITVGELGDINGVVIAEVLSTLLTEDPELKGNYSMMDRGAVRLELSRLNTANHAQVVETGRSISADGIVVGRIVRDSGLSTATILAQLIDTRPGVDISQGAQILKFAEVKRVNIFNPVKTQDAIREIGTQITTGEIPKISISTSRFDVITINRIDRDELPVIKLTVSVTDKDGNPVQVPSEVFKVEEEGVEVPIEVKHSKDLKLTRPFSVVLMVDKSGSMKGEAFKQAQAAAVSFIDRLSEKDRVLVLAFGSDIVPLGALSPKSQELTDKINALKAEGGTALYAALYDSLSRISASPGEKAVILLTDGKNDVRASSEEIKKTTLEEGLELARKMAIPVYTVGFGEGADAEVLSRIADETHSLYQNAETPEDILKVYLRLNNLLENQYIISYTTKSVGGEVNLSAGDKEDSRAYETSLEDRQRVIDQQEALLAAKQKDLLEREESLLQQVARREETITAKELDIANKEKDIESREKVILARGVELDDRAKVLATKEESLQTTEADLDERQLKIAKMEGDLKDREQVFSLREVGLDDRENKAKGKEDELTALEAVLQGKENNLEDMESDLLVLRGSLDGREKDLSQTGGELEARESLLAQRESLYSSREKDLKDLQNQLIVRKASAEGRDDALNQRASELSTLDDELTTKEQVLAQNEGELSSRENRVEVKEAELSDREKEVAATETSTIAKETQLDNQKEELAKREAEQNSKTSELDAAESLLDENRGRLNAREVSINSKEKDLAERETTLTQKEDGLTTRITKVDEREKSLADQEGALVVKDRLLDGRETKIAQREDELGASEKFLTGWEVEISERESVLVDKEQVLIKQETTLISQSNELIKVLQERLDGLSSLTHSTDGEKSLESSPSNRGR